MSDPAPRPLAPEVKAWADGYAHAFLGLPPRQDDPDYREGYQQCERDRDRVRRMLRKRR